MPITMAKKRPPQQPAKGNEDEQPRRPNRSGVPLHAWIDQAVMTALDGYVDGTHPRVSKTAAIEAALKDFLRDKGHWPPPPAKD